MSPADAVAHQRRGFQGERAGVVGLGEVIRTG